MSQTTKIIRTLLWGEEIYLEIPLHKKSANKFYARHGKTNDGRYSNPAFDTLMTQGAAETDIAKANATFQKAQEILLQDLPATPLWYSNVTGGYGTGVENVQFGWNSVPIYSDITKG